MSTASASATSSVVGVSAAAVGLESSNLNLARSPLIVVSVARPSLIHSSLFSWNQSRTARARVGYGIGINNCL